MGSEMCIRDRYKIVVFRIDNMKIIKTFTICLTLLFSLYKTEGDLLTNSNHCKDGTDPYCLSCGVGESEGEPGCILCAASFIDSSKVCKLPTSLVDNCGTYDSSTQKCLDCKKGFFISSDGFCVKHEIEGCLDPMSQSECRECDGYVLKEDKTCDLDKTCSFEGCSTCQISDNQEKCLKCEKGFVFSHFTDGSVNKCTKEETKLEGCAIIKDDKCISCQFGFYINSKIGEETKCTKSPAYESQYIVNSFIISFMVLLSLKA